MRGKYVTFHALNLSHRELRPPVTELVIQRLKFNITSEGEGRIGQLLAANLSNRTKL